MLINLPARPKESVPVLTDAPFSVASIPWRLKPEQDVLVVIAKSTLRLRPGRAALPLAESAPLSGDMYWDDDPSASLRYAADFAPLKPRTDVWLTGHAYPEPNAQTATASLGFGQLTRQVALIGERYWEPLGVTQPSRLRSKLALRFEHAFGGVGFAPNPLGRGFIAGGGARLLPSLEDPQRLIRSPGDRPEPCSLGPVAGAWAPRSDCLGSYDDRWLEHHWPYFPEDFDYGYFNAAPRSQQLESVNGAEDFLLEGVHPEHPRLSGRLPGRMARAFAQTTKGHGLRFTEVPLRLDTVAFEPDELLVHLVWRGFLNVSSAIAPELALVYVTSDDVERPTEVELCRRRFSAWLSGAAQSETQAVALRFGMRDPKREAQRVKERQRLGERLPLREAKRKSLPPPPPPALTRAEIEALVGGSESLVGRDFTGSDLRGVDLSGRDLSRCKLTRANLERAVFAHASLSGASLLGASCQAASFAGADLSQANLAESDLAGADFNGADLSQATLSACRGRGAQFTGAMLRGANFSEAVLEQASFAASDLGAADLSGARLAGADFRRASLDDVVAYEADLTHALFDEASMLRFRGDQADLSQASLYGAIATDSSFGEAKLCGARLDNTNLDGAVLAHADLTAAGLARASLCSARLRYAVLQDARAAGANLKEADLTAADLTRADLRGANLHGAETLNCKLYGAQLEQALLTATKLVHPILKRKR